MSLLFCFAYCVTLVNKNLLLRTLWNVELKKILKISSHSRALQIMRLKHKQVKTSIAWGAHLLFISTLWFVSSMKYSGNMKSAWLHGFVYVKQMNSKKKTISLWVKRTKQYCNMTWLSNRKRVFNSATQVSCDSKLFSKSISY